MVAEVFGYTQVSLYLVEGDHLVLQHQVGYPRQLDRIPVSHGVMGRVVRSGEPTLVADVRAEPVFLSAIAGVVSEVCVPLRADGRVVGTLNVESTGGVTLTDADLRLVWAVGEHVDIALGRARLHAAVHASEARFRAMVQNVSDVMAVVGTDGLLRYLSPAIEWILGHAPDQLVGQSIFSLVHPDDEESALEAFATYVRDSNAAHRIEARLRHRDGSWRWLEIVGNTAPEGPGLDGLVLNARDVTERKVAEADARTRAGEQAALLRVSQAVISGQPLSAVLAEVARAALGLAGAECCGIDLWHPETDELEVASEETIPEWPGVEAPGRRYALAEWPTRRAALERREPLSFVVDDPEVSEPMMRGDELVGVLSVQRYDPGAYGADDLRTLETIAEQAAAAVHNAELLARNRGLYLGGVRALVSAVDAKDPSTRGHSERVGRLAERIAAAMELGLDETETVGLAGLLHDVGKIGVPDVILQKPAPLDDVERAIMVGHVHLGAGILAASGVDELRPLVPLVQHHHERVDGRGYPDGLAGDAIPLGAAIIGAADAFDTMVTHRPYRSARTDDEAVEELRRWAGSQFRSDVVEAIASLVTAGGPAATVLPPAPSASDPDAPSAGQLGDTRALGLLVELAALTRHIPDLREFLHRVTGIVRNRLSYQEVMLFLIDDDRNELVLAAHSGPEPTVRPYHRQPLDVGVVGEVIRTGRPWNVPDVSREPRYHSERTEPRGSELAVPLVAEGRTIGAVNVESDRVAAFTAGDEAVLAAVAGQLASAVHVAQLHDAATRAAATDGLTGLANHRAFFEALRAAADTAQPFSLVLMDVEGLKRVNDSVGHLAGDALLRRVARTIRRAVRAKDMVARYGGDEFAVLMGGVSGEAATRVAARVRQELLTAEADDGVRSTVRYGVAALPDDGDRPTELVSTADRRLYEMRAQDGVRKARQ